MGCGGASMKWNNNPLLCVPLVPAMNHIYILQANMVAVHHKDRGARLSNILRR